MTSKASLIVFSLLIAHTSAQFSSDDLIGQVLNKTNGETEATIRKFRPKRVVLGDSYLSCGEDKECVPRYLCADGSISTTGEQVIDIRISDEICKYSEVCCAKSNKRDKPVIDPVPRFQHEGCGWRNRDGVAFRITGNTDNEAEFGEFPWMVAILSTEYNVGKRIPKYVCGGALIAPNVVLTAAHCTTYYVANQLIVRGGEWDTQNTDEILGHVDKPVKEIISHENYDTTTFYNDIALLILEESFRWEENIRPICLSLIHTNFDYSRCYVTGWGKEKFGRKDKYQVILKKIDLPVIPHGTCQNQLRDDAFGSLYNLHESFLCAGGEKDKFECYGDMGSPLACPIPGEENRYYQAGIRLWCAIGVGGFANVSHLLPWITEKLVDRDIHFQHFTPYKI